MIDERPDSYFLKQTRPRLQFLTDDQRQEIHMASLEVLERTGVNVMLPEAIVLLKEAGAYVIDESRVKIPSFLVEEALRSAPSRITIYDREGKPVMYLEGYNSYFGPGTDTPYVIDIESGQRRPACGDDVNQVARLCDALPNIDFVACMGGMSPDECDPKLSDRHNFYRILANTTKPILYTAWSLDGMVAIHKMAITVRSNEDDFRTKPFIIQYAEPITPLQHTSESLEKLLFCAEKGIPVAYVSAPIMGATSPVTVAGNLVLQNAEFLSGLVIAQLHRKGAPVIYGGGGTPMDMRSSVNIFNGPEPFLVHAAAKEMASFYGLPDFNTGGCSDSKVFDQQASAEAAVSLLQAAMTGSSLVHDVGYLNSGMTASLELILMADEMIDQIKHILKGIHLDSATLAVDVIAGVGPGGNYLANDHTNLNFRKIWYPRFFDRTNYDTWKAHGAKDLGSVLTKRVRSILQSHQPEPLTAENQKEIENILNSSVN